MAKKTIPYRIIFDPEFYERLRAAADYEQLPMAAFIRQVCADRIREIENEKVANQVLK